MSFDCIWVLPKNIEAPSNLLKSLIINRSFFYANELLAFKGDLYSEWLEYNLGYTLYEERKEKEKIKEINTSIIDLLELKELKVFEGEEKQLSIKEIKDFAIMWNIMSSLDACLVGWW